ncbi:MAG: ABC transporter ATP-binding protein [Phascolarctobacterium sp.]
MSHAVIQVNKLNIGYGSRSVLKNVSFAVSKGEIVGIIGCNGAGKSTLLKTIRGLLPKQKGAVSYFDKPLEEYTDKELATKIAYLQQHVEVGFGYTGKDLVMAGRYPYMQWWESENEKDEKLALACMAYTGTADLADRPVTEVSGGQKQRILIAKVLAQQTPIIFLDEPTTGLDMVYQEEIFRFAKALGEKGKTVLMVVHELNLAFKYCSRILLLGEGTLLADGTPGEVFTEELLSRAYKADLAVEHDKYKQNLVISTRVSDDTRQAEAKLLDEICDFKKFY